MTVKLAIFGQRDEGDLRAVRGGPVGAEAPVTDLLDDVDVVASFDLSPSARARTESTAPVEESVEDDDVLEIEVEGGFQIWTSAQRYREDVLLLRPGARLGDAVSVDTVPRVSERGITEWAASRLRVLRVRKDKVADLVGNPALWPLDLAELARGLGIDVAVKLPAWFATKVLIRIIESRLKPGPGLYTWADATHAAGADAPDPTPVSLDGSDVDKPILVFIHGTASSARGSFGGFLSQDAQPQWQALRQLFGDRIYAFEHRTLSDSPIDNAIDLLRALPRNARVSFVSHSRGGLIGDLVSLTSISTALLARFDRKDPQLLQADAHDRRQLELLAELVAEKQLRVERFVRCASPSRGTLLAGENIDLFLSVLTNLVGLIPGVGGTPLYEVTKRIALEIVRSRTVPSLIPGLEAMLPQSPLVALLNNLRAPAAGALGVVAGDIEGGSWLKRLGAFASDHIIYEARDNDLVVNTDAMFHGARRELTGYVFDQGGDVSHFNYFRNPRTRAALVEWLASSGRPPIFREIATDELDPVPMLRSMQSRAATDQPIVFVLPGIMGSHLDIGERGVWLRYLALLRGGLGDLADVDAENVRPVALVGDGYRELCEFLQDSHEVIPFAYDWRRSVTDSAQLLAVEVENALRRTHQPVRIVAHSMGGMVVRAMIATHPDLWDRLCERDGGRLVMLGTPNRGSHDIVEALLTTSATVQQLALLDLAHDKSQISAIVAKFPGALELLPVNGEHFDPALWRRYRHQYNGSAAPDDALLAAARETQDSLAGHLSLFPHSDRVSYVAGTSPRTVTGVDIIDGRVVLECTTEGDGRVTYESGRLPGVQTWYMDATHGDLASHRPGFRALQEVLETGATDLLSTTRPSTARGGALTYRALPEPVLYPTESSLAAGVLGKTPRRPYRQRSQASFRVSVVHGDLRYARYPIVVGHYEGDTIIGAEKQVDELMSGALSQRYSLGLYPGEFGSLAVILRQPTAVQKALRLPWGAVVIGLGKWGELSTGQLSDLLRRAVLQYVLELRYGLAASADRDESAAKLGLSLLLIGGNSTTNIAVGDSVGAILRAVSQANRELAVGSSEASTIQEVEIIELYADSAIEAAHATKRLAPLIGKELDTTIEAAQLLQQRRGRRRRLTSTTGRDAWRRWEVSVVTPTRRPDPPRLPRPLADRLKRAVLESDTADAELLAALAELAISAPTHSNEAHRELRFLTLSDRARAEATSHQRQPELVERLIKKSISKPHFQAEESRVLFELTIPNELKSGLAQVDNLVLVVDADSAAYPWELMSPGDKPLCITKGLVRQLQTSNYRPHIGARAGTAAYVVGDPQVSPPFRPLPGAAAEAKAVYDKLSGRFDVDEPTTRPTALDVLAGLYRKPYRIVHLAGHGYYEPATTACGARSGMVLDNGVFLTAVEVGQMQQVPELVFLNCCHIGQTGPAAAPATPAVEFNRLAASVSRELIEMGVRAVVAAGWAVADDAAKNFAEQFYEHMLKGETFGRALKAARVHTFDSFADNNTWGAYQAYGDPDYRLDPSGSGAATAGLGQVDVAEFIEAVNDIGLDAESHRGLSEASTPAIQTLGALVKACPTDWLALTDVQMAIGYAYGRLKQFDMAREYLVTALAGEGDDSTTTMRAVEQLASFEARLADDVENGQPERARELYESAVDRLLQLLAVAETAERHNLIGAALKRRAVAEQNSRAAKKALARAAEHYRQAHSLCLQRQGLDPYPTLNWMTLATLLDEEVPEADALLDRCEATARERFLTDRRFFTAIATADVALVRALRSGRLGQNGKAGDDAVAELKALYQEVIKKAAPTASELTSVCKQMTVTQRSLEKLSASRATTKAAAARLAELRRSIAGEGRDEDSAEPAEPSNQGTASAKVTTNGQRHRPSGAGITA